MRSSVGGATREPGMTTPRRLSIGLSRGLSLGGEPGSLWTVAADLLDPVLKRIFDELRVGVAEIHARIGQLPSTRDKMPAPTTVVTSITLCERSEDI